MFLYVFLSSQQEKVILHAVLDTGIVSDRMVNLYVFLNLWSRVGSFLGGVN